MNRIKTLLTVVIAAGFLASCGINDLEDRIENLEEGLGYDEPIKVTFTTNDYDGNELIEKGPFQFKGGASTSELYGYGDGVYNVDIQRYASLDMDNGSVEYINIQFMYDSASNTASDIYIEMSFVDNYFRYYVNPEFYISGDNANASIDIKSFNTETGSINLSFEGTTTEGFGGNIYEGNPMEISGSFKGKLKEYNND